jgi:glycosyltransferase involved in cell wall biosynthesis
VRSSQKKDAEGLGADRIVALDDNADIAGLKELDAVSGTLAYAIGAGKAIISTPYWHATELLAGGRGVLVPFEDSDAIPTGAIKLLDNPAACQAMRKRAYLYAREMVWNKVAEC